MIYGYDRTVSNLFSQIIIIYNPNSTGDSAGNATRLHDELTSSLGTSVGISLVPTEYAAHAEQIARDAAKKYTDVLLISSSGDGGYNEVVNGVITSGNRRAVCMVLPSGNANDHHEAVSTRSISDRILHPKLVQIDVIKVEAKKSGKPFVRYAHSYVGVGLTAYIGKKLTEATLNPVNEKWLVLRYLISFRSIVLKMDAEKRWHRYTNVVVSNIGHMSKVIQLTPNASVRDGKLELYSMRTNSTIRTVSALVFGSASGLSPTSQINNIQFTSRHKLQMQFDGEVIELDGKKPIAVSVAPLAIKTLE